MSKLLLDESPLVIQPKLASALGLNEAIFIQQIHYWLQRSENMKEGRLWSYHSYEELHDQFPFWSVRTIKRIVKTLTDNGLLLVDNFNKDKWNKTNWYALNYDELNRTIDSDNMARSGECQSDTVDSDNMARSYNGTETTTETTTENAGEEKRNMHSDNNFLRLISELGMRCSHRSKVKKTQEAYEAYIELTSDGGISNDDIIGSYVNHQNEKQSYALSLQNYLMDYKAIIKESEPDMTDTEKRELRLALAMEQM